MGIIMKDGRQYGVGGITPAENVTYGDSTVKDELDELENGLTWKSGGSVTALNSDISIPVTARELFIRVLMVGDNIGWTFSLIPDMLSSTAITYSVGGTGSTTNALWGADVSATDTAIRLTRVTKAGAAASSFQLAMWYR